MNLYNRFIRAETGSPDGLPTLRYGRLVEFDFVFVQLQFSTTAKLYDKAFLSGGYDGATAVASPRFFELALLSVFRKVNAI